MFEKFFRCFGEKGQFQTSGDLYRDIITQLGGKTYGKGLISFFAPEEIPLWTENIKEAFPWFQRAFRPFAYDWQGCVHTAYITAGGNEVPVIFNVGTDEIHYAPCTLQDYLDKMIPAHVDGTLAAGFFKKWSRHSKQSLKRNECVSYRIPLDYGGKDVFDNMEISDMDVYWTVLTAFRNAKQGEENRRKGPSEAEQ